MMHMVKYLYDVCLLFMNKLLASREGTEEACRSVDADKNKT